MKQKHIYEESFKTNKLKKLDFRGNQIKEIKINSFDGLNKLQIIYLRGNQITEIKVNSFIRLNNLQELSLNCNRIKKRCIFSY